MPSEDTVLLQSAVTEKNLEEALKDLKKSNYQSKAPQVDSQPKEQQEESALIDPKDLNFGDNPIEVLGHGSFGSVFKGKYASASVAIKVLNPDSNEFYKDEVRIMTQLRHPNIVSFYGYCDTPQCIVMEYMPEGSLYGVLHNNKKDLPWMVRIRIALNMAAGLEFLHKRKVLHKDIKSGNVLLDAQQIAKLSDFGLSKHKVEHPTKEKVGSILWMAPELHLEKGAIYTEKSDVYSLGMTFFELVTCKLPYANESLNVIPHLVLHGVHEPIPEPCPPTFKQLIEQCWAVTPEARPSASEIAKDLAEELRKLEASFAALPATVNPPESDESDLLPVVVHTSGEHSAQRRPAIDFHISYDFPIARGMGRAVRGAAKCAVKLVKPGKTKSLSMPTIDANVMDKFLQYVVESNLEETEKLLKQIPGLALTFGNITDLSGRKFEHITGFQYAVWALDWRMWSMIRQYLSVEDVFEQGIQSLNASWVKDLGVHAEHLLRNLERALKVAHDSSKSHPAGECQYAAWMEVGKAQRLLPAHVANEYCSCFK